MVGNEEGKHSRFQVCGNVPPTLEVILNAFESNKQIRRSGFLQSTRNIRALIMNTNSDYTRGASDDLQRMLRNEWVFIDDYGEPCVFWFDPDRAQYILACSQQKIRPEPVEDPETRLLEIKARFGEVDEVDEVDEVEEEQVRPRWMLYLTPTELEAWTFLQEVISEEQESFTLTPEQEQHEGFKVLEARKLVYADDLVEEEVEMRTVYRLVADTLYFRFIEIPERLEVRTRRIYLNIVRAVENSDWVPPHNGMAYQKSLKVWVEHYILGRWEEAYNIKPDTIRHKLADAYTSDGRTDVGWGIIHKHRDSPCPLICWEGFEPYTFVVREDVVELETQKLAQEPEPDVTPIESDQLEVVEEEAQEVVDPNPDPDSDEEIKESEPMEEEPVVTHPTLPAQLIHDLATIQSLSDGELAEFEATIETYFMVVQVQRDLIPVERKRRDHIAKARAKREEVLRAKAKLAAQLLSLEKEELAVAHELEQLGVDV